MSRPTTVLLVRHGASEGVGVAISSRLPGPALTIEGRVQADRVAARLRGVDLAGVYTSPMRRARATAEAIAAGRACGVRLAAELREVEFGAWDGATFAALAGDPVWRAYNEHRTVTRIPGGELALEVQTRAIRCIERLAATCPGGTVALVTHAEVIRAVVCACLGGSLDLMSRVPVDPASITRVARDGTVLALGGLNDVAHLERRDVRRARPGMSLAVLEP